jgi:hypothetical protein
MPSGISPAAVAAPAPANVFVDRFESVPAAGSSPREVRRGAAAAGHLPVTGVGLSRGLRRLASAVGDVGGILAFAYAVPLVILVIGIPVALLIRLAIWIVRAL